MNNFCAIARSGLAHWLQTGVMLKTAQPAGYAAACFVTLRNAQGALRGCIGTIEPTKTDLCEEIIANAIASGTRDHRFQPVTLTDLDTLDIEVSVLQPPQLIENFSLLDPARYGVVVQKGGKRGVLLPAIEGITTVTQQLAIVMEKAGIGAEDGLRVWRFKVEKYHE